MPGELTKEEACVIANDATVLAGSTGKVGSRKQGQLMSLAARKGYPLLMLGDANGGRLPDLLGSDFDFVVMAAGCSVALSGPSLVGSSTGAATTHEELGGAEVTARTTGVVSRVEPDEPAALRAVRTFLSYLPSHAALPAPVVAAAEPGTPGDRLAAIVPDRGRRGYDVRRVIDGIADAGSFFELHETYARSLVAGLARIDGAPVGIVANQPKYRGGVLDVPAIDKATRLVELCTTFGLPLIFLQDLPGVLVGLESERLGVARHLIALFSAIARSPVPKVTVVLRKAFGFGYIALGGAPMGTDYVVAWPNAEIGFMAANNAVQVVHQKRLARARGDEGDEAAAALAAALEREMHHAFAPWRAATQSFIHDVIVPAETRRAVLDGLFVGRGYR